MLNLVTELRSLISEHLNYIITLMARTSFSRSFSYEKGIKQAINHCMQNKLITSLDKCVRKAIFIYLKYITCKLMCIHVYLSYFCFFTLGLKKDNQKL